MIYLGVSIFFPIFAEELWTTTGKNAILEKYRKEAPCRVAQGAGGGGLEQVQAGFPEHGNIAEHTSVEGGAVPGGLPSRTVCEGAGLHAESFAWL